MTLNQFQTTVTSTFTPSTSIYTWPSPNPLIYTCPFCGCCPHCGRGPLTLPWTPSPSYPTWISYMNSDLKAF